MIQNDNNLHLMVWIWIVLIPLIVFLRWRKRMPGAGLILAFLLQMCVSYGIGGFIYALPGNRNLYWTDFGGDFLVPLGFAQSTIAFVALGIGSAVIAPILVKALGFRQQEEPAQIFPSLLAYLYIVIGCVGFIGIVVVRNIPSLQAIIAASWRLCAVGICLVLWEKWQKKQYRPFFAWATGAAILIPSLTILLQGFLSFGATMVLSIFAFMGSFMRPRWRVIVAACLLGYLGMSYFVTYMRDRGDIREAVWSGEKIGGRVGAFSATLTDFEWFSIDNDKHLERIDGRLNQNYLVGAGVNYIEAGFADYARGTTLTDAVIGLVPRVLWPNKPMRAGSGDLVSDYTGISFAEGISVGIGPVMEFYVNFGTVGVFFGFLVLSTCIALFDTAAGYALQRGDWGKFCYWFLPGISIVEVAGSMVEVVSSAAAGLLLALLINKYIFRRLTRRQTNEPGIVTLPTS